MCIRDRFGVCGVGWYTEIKRIWAEEGKDGRVAAFCEIHLYVKVDGEWSRPIEGIGGSMLVNVFKGSPETSDECYKMAYTDAISVAAKALGIGADVYWAAGRTKYSQDEKKEPVSVSYTHLRCCDGIYIHGRPQKRGRIRTRRTDVPCMRQCEMRLFLQKAW